MTHEFNPLDDDYFAQEMEREAQDALCDSHFSTHGRCISCLITTEISEQNLCEACESIDSTNGGALTAVINN